MARKLKISSTVVIATIIWVGVALAGEADIIAVDAVRSADGTYGFQVTVRHSDAGWEHYADCWEVLAPDGTELGTRVLLHPHDDEQPFTRSLSGVRIPAGVTEVILRVRDSRHDYGGREFRLVLP